jgi:hypothetical protein
MVLVCSFVLLFSPSFCQQVTQQPSSAISLLQRSLTVQAGNTQITDVTLNGTAQRVAGSDDEAGTVTVQVLSTGTTRLHFSFPSGSRSEYRLAGTDTTTGTWSGPDGIAHPIANQNLITDWCWYPQFTIASLIQNANASANLAGSETRYGQTVVHLAISQQFLGLTPSIAALFQHLSQVDIFLDASTLLPVSIVYATHPDDDAQVDIPVEMHFSDYRSWNGAQVPYRIQKFVNNTLAFDLQFQEVLMNVGSITAQAGAQ